MKNGPGEDIVMPLRFMGTSPDSSSLIPMLTSLCEQISINYNQNVDDIPDEVRFTAVYLSLDRSVTNISKFKDALRYYSRNLS